MADPGKDKREYYEKKRLALFLRTIRKSKGLSKNELADLAGYESAAKITELENANRLPSYEKTKDLANALGISIEQLKGYGKIELSDKGYAKLTDAERTALFLLAPMMQGLKDEDIRYLMDTAILLCKAEGTAPSWKQAAHQQPKEDHKEGDN